MRCSSRREQRALQARHARLRHAPLQRSLALLTAISAGKGEAVFRLAAEGLCSLLGADRCTLVIEREDVEPLRLSYPPSSLEPFSEATAARIQRVRETRQPARENPATALAIPIYLSHAFFGVLLLETEPARRWTQSAVALVEAVALELAQHLERARLTAAIERRTQELTVVCDTAVTVSAQLDLPTTLYNIVEQAARLVKADGGCLFLCDESAGELEVVVSYQMEYDCCGQRIKLDEGLAGRAARSRQIEWVANYRMWPERIAEEYTPFHAVLAVPLLQHDRVLGVLDLIHLKPGVHFSAADQAIVRLFTAQAVAAIDNARLYDQAHQYAHRTTALARATQLLDAQGNMDASIHPFANQSMQVLGAQGCLVLLADPHYAHVTYCVGLTEMQGEILRQSIAPRCACDVAETANSIHNCREHIAIDALGPVALEHGYHSTITLSLLQEERVLGCLTYFYAQPRVWSRDEVELARVVANQMAALVANALLYQELLTANRLKTEFVSTMSHELRTPMGAIMGYTELMQSGLYGTIPSGMREALNRVKANADHLLNMINQMLDLSRIEARRLELHIEPYSPGDVLQSISGMLQSTALTKGLDMQVRIAADTPPVVLGDVGRVSQILVNLIGNSVKFTQAGTIDVCCAVSYEMDVPHLIFTVSDTGPGIPPEQLELIWEPFRQGDSSTTREFGGTGLGLAIVRRLTELMQGSATVSSTVGSGSTFTISLPLNRPVSNAHGIESSLRHGA